MGNRRFLAFGVALLLPLGAIAQAAPVGEPEGAEEPCGTAICGEDAAVVSGAPFDLTNVGRVREQSVPPGPPLEVSPWWGIQEHELYVVPSNREAYEPDSGALPLIPRPQWPSDHQLHDWNFAEAYTYPELTRSLNFEAFTFVGGDGHDHPVFADRVRANLYVLEFGVTFFDSVAGVRDNRTDMDLDLRVPFTLGRHHQLAVLPGVTFPIDSREWLSSNTNIRAQAIYGFSTDGFAFQLRAGFIDGQRRAGYLHVRERIDQPATLYGALVAWRFVPAIQVRAEASGEISTDSGRDRITILPGFAFFPLGDPRVTVGASAIIEASARRFSFDNASYGALFNVGAGFY